VVRRLAKDEVLIENLEALGEQVTTGKKDVGLLPRNFSKDL